ncbi:hypothetical protein OH807_14970 [Kitasatospora sp. NBC_01560]|uniref:hypothetical protein n=1 Tax=Kitasatospora sp. NBC_01560 TaxID=2975965 RepID=UPI00386486BC
MTTLDQSATASDHPSAGAPSDDLPPPADGDSESSAAAATCCSITAADSGTTGAVRADSVPRPRGGQDGETAPGAGTGSGEGARTAALIRAGLAERLREAYGQGRSLTELAAACRRPVAEIHALLAEGTGGLLISGTGPGAGTGAGTGVGAGTGSGGFVRLQQPVPQPVDRTIPVLRATPEEVPRTVRSKRPGPSRRLRRMHPEAAAPAEQAESVQPHPAAPPRSDPSPADATGPSATTGPLGATTAPAPLPASTRFAAGSGAGAEVGTPAATETPLGILIGASPNLPEPVGRPEERQPVRVAAELVRVGRGTVLVVLPAWRPSIAVSVPTEHLLHATGLGPDRLAEAQLSVLINPGALHDRELNLHGWQVGPAERGARRGGRTPGQ